MDLEEPQRLIESVHARLLILSPDKEGHYHLVLTKEERWAVLTALEVAGEL